MTSPSPDGPQPRSRALRVAASLFIVVVSLVAGGCLSELALRLKNASMRNYDIEMWRYSNELKVESPDPVMDFDHARSRTALLQGTEIRLNELGLRGGPIEPLPAGARRILFLGASITLGWGVAEQDTITGRIQQMLRDQGSKDQVLNAGIGNYNAERYVTRFFNELTPLEPTDIVVHYFLRDAEDLVPASRSAVLKRSQLAVTLWIAYQRLFGASGDQSLEDHYRAVYDPNARGFKTMIAKLKELAGYARDHKVRIILAMTPDIHNLTDYKMGFAHERMSQVAQDLGFEYVDLLPALQNRSAAELFAMPGDPHPNALGHLLMAQRLFPAIESGGSR